MPEAVASYPIQITLLAIPGTLLVYLAVRRLHLLCGNPLVNIVVLSAAVIIAVLLFCGLPYAAYEPAKNIMTALLGPATVALALPLHRYRKLLRKNALAILGGVGVGTFTSMFFSALIAKLGGLPHEVVISIMPKGASIPFGVELANLYGGIPSLTAAFTVATGTLGSLLGAWTLNKFRIGNPMARGLALGTVSHAQGTAAALQEGEEQGAMAGLAMVLAGLLTVALFPATLWLLQLFLG